MPDVEVLLLAAWKVESPSSIPQIEAKGRFPQGFWPNIARRAAEWIAQGLTAEQVQAEVAAAAERYEAHWSNVFANAPAQMPRVKQNLALEDLGL